jgi:hypothetical protein
MSTCLHSSTLNLTTTPWPSEIVLLYHAAFALLVACHMHSCLLSLDRRLEMKMSPFVQCCANAFVASHER